MGSTTISANQWYHVAIVADGTSLLKIYLNGTLETAVLQQNETTADGSQWFADVTNVTANDHFISIGATSRGGGQETFFNGKIDDIRIYDHALSDVEVQHLYGLVEYFPFSGNANDSSGNGHHGTVHGASLTTDRSGAGSKAYSFNGTSDYIQTAADNALSTFHTGTVSFWFSTPTPATDGTILAYSTAGDFNSLFMFWIHLQKVTVQYKYPSQGYNPDVMGSTTISANQWYHVAIVADGTSLLKIYLNDTLETAVLQQNETTADGSQWFADVTNVSAYDHFISIGALSRGGGQESFFNGKIDDIRIYHFSGTTSAPETPRVRSTFLLEQNYPNPFNPSTTIQYTLANRQLTVLKVYDVLGREVETLVNEVKSPGTYSLRFDGKNLASGVYLYRIQAGNFIETRKFVLLR
jgi:hypothetical protein